MHFLRADSIHPFESLSFHDHADTVTCTDYYLFRDRGLRCWVTRQLRFQEEFPPVLDRKIETVLSSGPLSNWGFKWSRYLDSPGDFSLSFLLTPFLSRRITLSIPCIISKSGSFRSKLFNDPILWQIYQHLLPVNYQDNCVLLSLSLVASKLIFLQRDQQNYAKFAWLLRLQYLSWRDRSIAHGLSGRNCGGEKRSFVDGEQ